MDGRSPEDLGRDRDVNQPMERLRLLIQEGYSQEDARQQFATDYPDFDFFDMQQEFNDHPEPQGSPPWFRPIPPADFLSPEEYDEDEDGGPNEGWNDNRVGSEEDCEDVDSFAGGDNGDLDVAVESERNSETEREGEIYGQGEYEEIEEEENELYDEDEDGQYFQDGNNNLWQLQQLFQQFPQQELLQQQQQVQQEQQEDGEGQEVISDYSNDPEDLNYGNPAPTLSGDMPPQLGLQGAFNQLWDFTTTNNPPENPSTTGLTSPELGYLKQPRNTIQNSPHSVDGLSLGNYGNAFSNRPTATPDNSNINIGPEFRSPTPTNRGRGRGRGRERSQSNDLVGSPQGVLGSILPASRGHSQSAADPNSILSPQGLVFATLASRSTSSLGSDSPQFNTRATPGSRRGTITTPPRNRGHSRSPFTPRPRRNEWNPGQPGNSPWGPPLYHNRGASNLTPSESERPSGSDPLPTITGSPPNLPAFATPAQPGDASNDATGNVGSDNNPLNAGPPGTFATNNLDLSDVDIGQGIYLLLINTNHRLDVLERNAAALNNSLLEHTALYRSDQATLLPALSLFARTTQDQYTFVRAVLTGQNAQLAWRRDVDRSLRRLRLNRETIDEQQANISALVVYASETREDVLEMRASLQMVAQATARFVGRWDQEREEMHDSQMAILGMVSWLEPVAIAFSLLGWLLGLCAFWRWGRGDGGDPNVPPHERALRGNMGSVMPPAPSPSPPLGRPPQDGDMAGGAPPPAGPGEGNGGGISDGGGGGNGGPSHTGGGGSRGSGEDEGGNRNGVGGAPPTSPYPHPFSPTGGSGGGNGGGNGGTGGGGDPGGDDPGNGGARDEVEDRSENRSNKSSNGQEEGIGNQPEELPAASWPSSTPSPPHGHITSPYRADGLPWQTYNPPDPSRGLSDPLNEAPSLPTPLFEAQNLLARQRVVTASRSRRQNAKDKLITFVVLVVFTISLWGAFYPGTLCIYFEERWKSHYGSFLGMSKGNSVGGEDEGREYSTGPTGRAQAVYTKGTHPIRGAWLDEPFMRALFAAQKEARALAELAGKSAEGVLGCARLIVETNHNSKENGGISSKMTKLKQDWYGRPSYDTEGKCKRAVRLGAEVSEKMARLAGRLEWVFGERWWGTLTGKERRGWRTVSREVETGRGTKKGHGKSDRITASTTTDIARMAGTETEKQTAGWVWPKMRVPAWM